jgi:hypothetical protein
MINLIRTSTTGHILGLVLIAIAGISAGCSAKAETIKQIEPPVQKREVAVTTQTPEMPLNRNPNFEMPQDGDLEYSTPAPKTTSAALTKLAFDKIKVGMNLAEVEKMLGDKGMLVSTMDINGRKTQTYKWSNDNFTSYIDVTVENNNVIEKKNKGLK